MYIRNILTPVKISRVPLYIDNMLYLFVWVIINTYHGTMIKKTIHREIPYFMYSFIFSNHLLKYVITPSNIAAFGFNRPFSLKIAIFAA
jgi:hypothetical protein